MTDESDGGWERMRRADADKRSDAELALREFIGEGEHLISKLAYHLRQHVDIERECPADVLPHLRELFDWHRRAKAEGRE